MAAGYHIVVNGTAFLSAEAVYQASRYPHLPEIQELIRRERSPMSAKMKSKSNYEHSRSDWEQVKVAIMRWSLRVKLAQHFHRFGRLLESTGDHCIVEESRRDAFWGALRQKDGTLVGTNALGRLLMELRQLYNSPARYSLLYVSPPDIPDFAFFGYPAGPIDARGNFINSLLQSWGEAGLAKVEKIPLDQPSIASLGTEVKEADKFQKNRSDKAAHCEEESTNLHIFG